MNLNNNANKAAILPNVRDIFFSFDFLEQTTPAYDEKKEIIIARLEDKFKTFSEYDEIDSLITENAVEAQATGFQQGFAFAMNLIKGGMLI